MEDTNRLGKCNNTQLSEEQTIKNPADESLDSYDLIVLDIIEKSNEEKPEKPNVDTAAHTNGQQSEQILSNEITCIDLNATESLSPINNNEDEVDSGVQDTPVNDPKQALAFTIDFNDSNRDGIEKRSKSVLEKIRNRHQRTRLERCETDSNISEKLSDRSFSTETKPTRKPLSVFTRTTPDPGGVKLRDKSTRISSAKVSNRHSWSPNSSSTDLYGKPPMLPPSEEPKHTMLTQTKQTNGIFQTQINQEFKPKSKALQMALKSTNNQRLLSFDSCVKSKPETINFCLQPLDVCKLGEDNASVSDAGTYTIEGDNYTEEQKEGMNIDRREALEDTETSNDESNFYQNRLYTSPFKQRSLETKKISGNKNILEVSVKSLMNPSEKLSGTYLERLKNHIKETNEAKQRLGSNEDMDKGTFTSVTSCGVLSKKSLHTNNYQHRRLGRKNSLTKSMVDSSEYVQNPFVYAYEGDGESTHNSMRFTDSEKSQRGEYKLNIFNEKNIVKLNNNHADDSDDEKITIGVAKTKNDWIHQWAKNARKNTAQMTRSYDFSKPSDSNCNPNALTQSDYTLEMTSSISNEFGHNLDLNLDNKYGDQNVPYKTKLNRTGKDFNENSDIVNRPWATVRRPNMGRRPPPSPTKIPSPIRMQQYNKIRSPNSDSDSDLLSSNDTEMYLQKTADAIYRLNRMHNANSMENLRHNNDLLISSSNNSSPVKHSQNFMRNTKLSASYKLPRYFHRRNLSLDNNTNRYSLEGITSSQSYNDQIGLNILNDPNFQQTLDRPFSPKTYTSTQRKPSLKDLSIQQDDVAETTQTSRRAKTATVNRSNSFNINKQSVSNVNKLNQTKQPHPVSAPIGGKNAIKKSASTNNFNRPTCRDYSVSRYDGTVKGGVMSDSDDNQSEQPETVPLSNTKYNKTFMIRMQQNKMKAMGYSAGEGGVMACPNTPEMPRRAVGGRTNTRDRCSMPRDSSLNRMKLELDSRNVMPARQTNLTASKPEINRSVQPKYLDISKYKSPQSQNFLRRDESRSTLQGKEIRKSPSASLALNRNDPSRVSNRSIKSAGGARPTGKPNPLVNKNEIQAQKIKEQELAMWKRRASYDPMRAAAEGKKKQMEARRKAQQKIGELENEKSNVFRSQSFHSGMMDPMCNMRTSDTIDSPTYFSSDDDEF